MKLKSGHMVALDFAPLFAGVESGCFEEQGLEVETVFFALRRGEQILSKEGNQDHVVRS
jgi:hypothetical protein